MKRTKGICIFLVLTLSAVILVSLSTELFQDKEKNELSQSDVTKKTLPSSQIKEYQFVVVEESGNLVVYYVNQKIKYLSTDIPISNLPQELQKKVKDGLNFENEKSLYDFREDYSS